MSADNRSKHGRMSVLLVVCGDGALNSISNFKCRPLDGPAK